MNPKNNLQHFFVVSSRKFLFLFWSAPMSNKTPSYSQSLTAYESNYACELLEIVPIPSDDMASSRLTERSYVG